MWYFNFKIAYRNLLNRKGFSLLNILGLTIGMTSCLLIFHYVSNEKSFDNFVSEDTYRIRLDYYQEGKLEWQSATSYPGIAPALKVDFPEVKSTCRLIDADVVLINKNSNTKFHEKQGYFGDTTFFSMFNVNLIEGNKQTALNGPSKIILSSVTAKKYFGNSPAVGKTITVKHASLESDSLGMPFEVTGVFDFPKNSHLDIQYLFPLSTLKSMIKDTANSIEKLFDWYDYYTYIKLAPGSDPKKLEAAFPAFCKKYMVENQEGGNMYNVLSLIPVKDIHLHSNYNQEAEVNGSGRMVYFLFLIAIFIIVIAWINYINLTTARSAERAKEVGVKKVVGAGRSDLIKQFFAENILLNSTSLVISVILFLSLSNTFDHFTQRSDYSVTVLSSSYWMWFILLFAFGTFISGIYPAFVLSGFQPVKVLKGAFKNTASGNWLRKGLTVSQFVVSVVLIAGTIIVFQQVQFMRKKELGANINQTLVLEGAGTASPSRYMKLYQPFKTEVLQLPGIKSLAASSNVMGQEIYWTNAAKLFGANDKSYITAYNLGVDYDFVPAYELKMVAGRNFSPSFKSDEKGVLLNEHAVRLLNAKSAADIINKKIANGNDTLAVIGVIADYHHEGVHKAVNPLLIKLTPDIRRYYSIKMTGSNPQETIASLKKIWDRNFPDDEFKYFFLDETFQAQYTADELFGKVFSIFAFLAIFIACSGLLGLSAYSISQRSKEIGIRKVLGASVKSILVLLSRDFMLLVLVAFLVAIPLSWYLMNSWLQDFAYRVSISWWVFVTAGGIAFFMALLTITTQTLKAVKENPIKNLKTE
ncbi:MAG: FtsX-like permease family protein [Bacteroidetes bacterium]|jgi:putative ABC transport system permease protein|nr:FtsX-like permease family protein [Bacteroidota bacterium]